MLFRSRGDTEKLSAFKSKLVNFQNRNVDPNRINGINLENPSKADIAYLAKAWGLYLYKQTVSTEVTLDRVIAEYTDARQSEMPGYDLHTDPMLSAESYREVEKDTVQQKRQNISIRLAINAFKSVISELSSKELRAEMAEAMGVYLAETPKPDILTLGMDLITTMNKAARDIGIEPEQLTQPISQLELEAKRYALKPMFVDTFSPKISGIIDGLLGPVEAA